MTLAPDATSLLAAAEAKLLAADTPLTFEDALALAEAPSLPLPALLALAHRVRLAYCGEGVELESLISAKTGGCPEDCAFCSQSARFASPVQRHPMLEPERILEAARATAAAGASQFCIVVAVRGPDERMMRQVLAAIDLIHAATSLKVDCSLGILTRGQAQRLHEAGVYHYNHNLEAARSFFPQIVTTHSWDERAQTCRYVKDVGMGLCSGGIFGMGETWRQRVEMAFELRELGVDEVPLNFLNPRPGTPLGGAPVLAASEALKVCALYRLILPGVTLRYGGGRELVLRDLQALGLVGGVNAMIVGNYLTTTGRPAAEDLQLLVDLGMPVKP